MREASRELKDQHVGQAMRDAAEAMREAGADGQAASKASTVGRGAARALDRLADRLSDATGQRDGTERRLSDQLARARDVRERMGELQRQIAELQGTPGQPGTSGKPATAGQQPGPQGEGQAGQPSGRQGQGGQQGKGSESASSRQASPSPGGQGQGGASPGDQAGQATGRGGEPLERLKREYAEQVREAARLRQEMEGRQGTRHGGDGAGSTPEGQLMVMSAPGTEAFKQDFSKWDVLHKDVTLGLERLEASLSQQLLEKALKDRLAAGAADQAPGEYQDAVDRYFRSIASPKD